MKLETTFHATVDCTNGNTWLDPVHATFGKTTVETGYTFGRSRAAEPQQPSDREDEF